ncbi:MAG: CBS domain-containing protein [Acidobacteria bacterium]|nr:CBS domain-containing protein [Acidobacteriota bacterium]
MKVRDIMTPDPEVVTPEEPISRAARIMRDYDVGIVPVVGDSESRNLVGVITDRDIACRHVADVVEKVSEPGHTRRADDRAWSA